MWPERTLDNFADAFKATVLHILYFRSKMVNKKQGTFNLQSNS